MGNHKTCVPHTPHSKAHKDLKHHNLEGCPMHKEASSATSLARKVITQLAPQANENMNDMAQLTRMALCCLDQSEAIM